VTVEGGKRRVDPALDPFDQKNGYNANGPSRYSKAFQDRYFSAQARRMNELIDGALASRARIARGDYPYPDDDIVIIPSGGNPGAGAGGDAKLASLDPSITSLMSTARPEKLLRNDGSITLQVVKSVFVAEPELARTNRAFDTGTKIFTLKSFLSANAIRATNANDMIDYCSSNNSTTCAVGSISVPVLIAAMGAYHGRVPVHPRRRDHLRQIGE
jgi:hypothetical protein